MQTKLDRAVAERDAVRPGTAVHEPCSEARGLDVSPATASGPIASHSRPSVDVASTATRPATRHDGIARLHWRADPQTGPN